MRRREFITLLGGAATAWPAAARAQQQAMPVIGLLHPTSQQTTTSLMAEFRQGLSNSGYVEGRNIAIEYRWADGQSDRLPALAADLVRRQVNVIAAPLGLAAPLAAKVATTSIPIIFGIAGDPVEAGLVASLNRPGGNLTGVTSLSAELVAKRLELLHELVPTATTIALLVDPTNPEIESVLRHTQVAAHTLGVELRVFRASAELDFDSVFATLDKQRVGALLILPASTFLDRREQLGALTLRHSIPAIHAYREFVVAGGLVSYGGSLSDMYRLVGVYTGRILKGEKPADLPVQQGTKAELIINLKTAKALGLTVPLALLTRADEVIE
jgi:putative ABC transport system substrate-binding protein